MKFLMKLLFAPIIAVLAVLFKQCGSPLKFFLYPCRFPLRERCPGHCEGLELLALSITATMNTDLIRNNIAAFIFSR